VEIVLPAGKGVLYGHVLEQGTRRPVAGRPVYVWSPAERRTLGQTVTDESGAYEIGALPAGSLRLRFALQANAEGGLEGRELEDGGYEILSPYPDAYVDVELLGGERRRVDVSVPRVRGEGALARTVELDVTVVDETTREPIAGAYVYVQAQLGDLWVDAGDGQMDDAGQGTVRLLASGRYSVRVAVAERDDAPRHAPKRVEIALRGTHGTLDVGLARVPDGDGSTRKPGEQ